MGRLAERLELANSALKGDWCRWQESMRTDLKSAFVCATEKNIQYYEKVRRKRPPGTLLSSRGAFLAQEAPGDPESADDGRFLSCF